jgi:hypothetical protein
MHDKHDHTIQELPVSNYGSAVARAVEWLGDRYLLAKPINAHMRPSLPFSAIRQHQQLKGV